MGELVSLLALCDEEPLCINCCHRLGRQCAALMSEHLYRYAEHRGSNTSLGDPKKSNVLHGAVKEQAVSLVQSGVKTSLEDALEHLGYRRGLAANIYQDRSVRVSCHVMPGHGV